MRSGGRLWMVTFANGEPSPFDEELPCYFRTRDAAKSYLEEMEYSRQAGEWDWSEDDRLVVAHAPDDVRENDIAWDDG